MGGTAAEASNRSMRSERPAAARQLSCSRIFPRSPRCVASPAVRRGYDRLDILVNNAGIGSGGSGASRQTSHDGHELRFAVNYLAGFLLTRTLLPLLMLGQPARIVNVSSLGQQPIDFDDVMLTRGYGG
jgi:NAD(P)-dependent dehydrogenase (short-subunit alcohol dehydrogenase family)